MGVSALKAVITSQENAMKDYALNVWPTLIAQVTSTVLLARDMCTNITTELLVSLAITANQESAMGEHARNVRMTEITDVPLTVAFLEKRA